MTQLMRHAGRLLYQYALYLLDALCQLESLPSADADPTGRARLPELMEGFLRRAKLCCLLKK